MLNVSFSQSLSDHVTNYTLIIDRTTSDAFSFLHRVPKLSKFGLIYASSALTCALFANYHVDLPNTCFYF